MAQATRYGQLTFSDYVERALREGAMWTLMCVAIYLAIALASYAPDDPGWSYVGDIRQVTNAAGRTGAWFADVALYLFGFFAYLLPIMVAWSAWLVFRGRGEDPSQRTWVLSMRWIGFLVTLAAGCGYATLHAGTFGIPLPNGPGGGLGLLVSSRMREAFNIVGTDLLLGGALLVGLTLFSGISWVKILDNLGAAALQGARLLGALLTMAAARTPLARPGHETDSEDDTATGLPRQLKLIDPPVVPDPDLAKDRPQSRMRRSRKRLPPGVREALAEPEPLGPDIESEAEETMSLEDLIRSQKQTRRETLRLKKNQRVSAPLEDQNAPPPPVSDPITQSALAPIPCVERPPLELLDAPHNNGWSDAEDQIEDRSLQVESHLADLGVLAQVVEVYPGPVVTLFELQLAPGIQASKLTGLTRELARAFSSSSVRVIESIPGKSVIGIELPNTQRETMFLREILASEAYQDATSPLTLGIGADIFGLPVVIDLARLPHALIAGTTGSGKSVAINAMILSLLYKSAPEDVRLILVDPKMLALSVYAGLPHLLTPIITDINDAANALRWAVGEMERRYRLMSKLGVRNIGGYNRQIAAAEAAGTPIPNPTVTAEDVLGTDGVVVPLGHLPYLVIIIDELADMMVVDKKVDELIARLAQKARASGIHLLLATQRPAVDVLTGLIKANIPARIAFQVASRIDSRTVLDQMGAEQLLGRGDMLYLPPGDNIPQRVHGAFVDDHEVHKVVEFLKQQYGEPHYIEDVLREPTESLPGSDVEPRGGAEDADPLFDDAVQIVLESRRTSISGVQRRLKIGYNRAARMIEEMERIGIVGPAETNGNRDVLTLSLVDN